MNKNKPQPIGDILQKMLDTTTLGENLEQAKIWEHWEELTGKHLAAHCKPVNIKEGQLRITVESPVWMHKISYIKWDLIQRINRMAGKEIVSDVYFLLDRDDVEKDLPSKEA
ncbi:MAG: DUF721 domain-containing protein [Candidatus Hydrogenedentes bacterium]|nr:DUF721 domain-containing protein [Candidatus Hydrogenedentota bacterium]